MTRKLTTEEIVYIAKNYGEKGPSELGRELGVPSQKVATIASKLRQQGIPVEKRQVAASNLKDAVSILKEGEKFNLFKK